MKKRIINLCQRLGRSFMLPIAVLPIVGLFLGLGNSFTNKSTIDSLHLSGILYPESFIYQFFTLLKYVGNAIFDNLPMIFAAAIALGMTKKMKEVAVLSSVLAFIVMHATINGLLVLDGDIVNNQIVGNYLAGSITQELGFYTLEMGVFGGIIVGLGVSYLHNKFCDIQLPTTLSFFEGERFVPIISTTIFLFVGILAFHIWPIIQNGTYHLGQLVADSGVYGTFVYGVIKRLLVPFGLHHAFYLPFYQTGIGGTMIVNGTSIAGAQNIILAQLNDPSLVHFSYQASRYFTGEYLVMLFGLPGAALAMYRCSEDKSKKIIAALYLTSALTSILTGITEPVEFAFLFVAPMLYGIHVLFNGLAFVLAQLFKITIGFTFSASLIDFFVLGVLQGNDKTNWILIIPIGIVYFILYYVSFTFCIKHFNYHTPGREENKVSIFKKPMNFDESTIDHQSQLIIQGLGGRYNFYDLDCCVTRIRVIINDSTRINEGLLKQAGAAAVMKQGDSLQVIFGPKAASIKRKIEEYISKVPAAYDFYDKNTLVNNQDIELGCIVDGEVLSIESSSDKMFSNKLMGDGVVIIPDNSIVVAPGDGIISMIYPTKHAMGIILDNGYEVLIHIGCDTVNLQGQGFELFVEVNQRVSKGDLLWNLDLSYIKEHVEDSNIIFVLTNLKDNVNIDKHYGNLKKDDLLLVIKD